MKNLQLILGFAGLISILNGLGNFFFKSFSLNYLIFMMTIGIVLLALAFFISKKK